MDANEDERVKEIERLMMSIAELVKANGELARMLDLEKAQGGNAAKLRDALERIKKFVKGQCEIANDDARAILDNINAALSAHPRNCDMFATAEEAERAFSRFCNSQQYKTCRGCSIYDSPIPTCAITWLFSPATPDKGGEG